MPSLTFSLRRVKGGHGADDYETDEGTAWTLEARLDGTVRGTLDYNLVGRRRGTVHVRWIEVDPAWRRRGIGRALLGEARRRYPEADIETNGFTEDGEALWSAAGLR